MKKIILLFASALLGLGAMAQDMAFTFTRGSETKTATVTSPEGVTATIASNVEWLTTGAMGTRTDVLCPNKNTNATTDSDFITYTLSVSGLAQDKVFSAVKFTNVAVRSTGDLQPNNTNDIRHCDFTLTANDTEVKTLDDQNIWFPNGQSERVVTLEGNNTFTPDAEGNLVIELKLVKGTTNNGCFYGLTKIELVEADLTVVHTFSADKVYYIQPKKAGTTYLTENRDKILTMANKDNSKYQFWKLIPVEGKSHCYHIQNVVTGHYIAACAENATNNTQATTGTEPVEYYIGATASTIDAIAGCYYMASTNWDGYANESGGPKCLNTGGADGGNVVTYTAGPNGSGGYKQNSYWRFEETTEEWQRPVPPAHTEQTKVLTVYFRPCGAVSNTYLTAATIGGVDPIAYAAAAKPGSFYVPCSKDRGAVRRGSTFEVSITLNSTEDADLKANAYFDWNADGEFETTQAITLDGAAGTATVTVPDDAVSGDTRMRIRLNSNGLDYADDDVEGFVYDFPLTVVDATTERKVYVDVNGDRNGTVALSAAGDSHVVGTQLTATATPKGTATFESWREGGVVVSRDAEYTFTVEDRNMTLKAYFTPNTPVEASWDITFDRTSTTTAEATVEVTGKGAAVEGVTATIAIAGGAYQNKKETADNTGNTGILCIDRNTTAATEADPNKYTLTITNNSSMDYVFDYVAVAGVALNSEGAFQGTQTVRARNFKVTLGETVLPVEQLTINDDNHCSGKETSHAFAQPITVAAGETYTIQVAIYANGGAGCFYGLTRIALGNTVVNIGATGYTTLYTPIAMTVPAGVSFYKGALNEAESVLTLTAIEAGTAIPHETAVIIEGEPNSEFTYATAARNSSAVSGNDLKGTHAAVATTGVAPTGKEVYTLQSHEEYGVAFKRFVGDNLAGGKAYLLLTTVADAQQAPAVRIRFADEEEGEGGTTAIDNEQLTIDNSQFTIYDLQGRRVLIPTKGIYIVNGKKIVIK